VQSELETNTLAAIDIRDMEQPAQREVGVHVLRNRILAPPIRDFLRLVTNEYGTANIFEPQRGATAEPALGS
jgi:hypothetical protein